MGSSRLLLLCLLLSGASSRVVSPRMRLLRTEALLSRILDEVNQAPLIEGEEMIDSPGDGGLQAEEAVFADNSMVATPSNVNTSCVNETSCCLYRFDLSPKSEPLSSVHMWLRKTTSDCVNMSVWWERNEQERTCGHLKNVSEVKSVLDWGMYDLSSTLAAEYTNQQVFCTVKIFGLSLEEHDQKPFLVATTNRAAAKRKRRSANTPNCNLVNFYISFKQIGWYWVVAPKGFNAKMCSGRCSNQINSYPSPHHQVLSTILNNRTTTQLDEDSWTPCCSATKLSPLDMIYVAANTTNSTTTASIVYRKIENMVTESCGCW